MEATVRIDMFKAKALLADPALYMALAVLLLDVYPGLGAWAHDHETALRGVWIVLAGHFLVRASGVVAAGKAAASPHANTDVFQYGEPTVDPVPDTVMRDDSGMPLGKLL